MHPPPLSGELVVDLSTGIAGAYCSKLLADGGARVLKVERGAGDPLRSWASSASIPSGEDGALFKFLASGAESAVLVAGAERDDELLLRILDAADVVVWTSGAVTDGVASLQPHVLR